MAATPFVVLFTKLLLCAIDDDGPISQKKREQQEKEQRRRLDRRWSSTVGCQEKTKTVHSERAATESSSSDPLEARLPRRPTDGHRRSSNGQHHRHSSSSGSSRGQKRGGGYAHGRRGSYRRQ